VAEHSSSWLRGGVVSGREVPCDGLCQLGRMANSLTYQSSGFAGGRSGTGSVWVRMRQ
jgi:hypothetical protein